MCCDSVRIFVNLSYLSGSIFATRRFYFCFPAVKKERGGGERIVGAQSCAMCVEKILRENLWRESQRIVWNAWEVLSDLVLEVFWDWLCSRWDIWDIFETHERRRRWRYRYEEILLEVKYLVQEDICYVRDVRGEGGIMIKVSGLQYLGYLGCAIFGVRGYLLRERRWRRRDLQSSHYSSA